jgi:hypothetical protein
MVNVETARVPEAAIVVVFKLRFAPEVDTDPSKTTVVPSDLKARNHAAVPATVAVSEVMELAVATPRIAEAKAVAFQRSSASLTWIVMEVLAFAGWVPS